ncbi:recombination regulator RecX [Kitasatospora sp. NBC_01287]|uniref:recombination regulator RecX n=1 Tax=Kitasatospora sp. NBC_01287 TaxID=2903573 RepID=UPI002B1D906C|nr:recombination regulator RecX [Kitasatospora sp. NBC_01287]
MRSEPGGESAQSGDWGPRDWCASGIGGESVEPAPEPAAGRPRRAARAAAEPRPSSERREAGAGWPAADRPPLGGPPQGWQVEVKGEQEGERPDWVVDTAERGAPAEPPAAPARARGGVARGGSTGRGSGARGFGERAGGARAGGAARETREPRESYEPREARVPREPGRSSRSRSAGARAAAERAAAEQDPAARARDICLRLLTGTPRTRKQLGDALRKREIPEEVADEVLSRFEEVGLIDDAAFAAAWVESRHAGRGLARRALAQELRTRGVAGALVEEAVAQLDPEEEAATARALVERKLRTTAGLERQARMRRLVGMLARRGYPEGLAFRVVREVLDAEGESTEELEDWSLG